MKKVNKDYIGVVRNHSGRLHYERIPMLKSDKVINKLIAMADEKDRSLEEMAAYLRSQPLFEFMVSPFYEDYMSKDCYNIEDEIMKDLVDELKISKTKARFLNCALMVIQECDYRWNSLRVINSLPDLLIRTHEGYEATYLKIRLTKDTTIIFESTDLGCDSYGNLNFTVCWNDLPVLPYRSLVEMYDFSEDILEVTKGYDPDTDQWDNALRCLTATANAIIENEEAFYRQHVVEAGQEMLEKIKLMCLDSQSYYTWLENIQDKVTIDYSECGKSLDPLYDKDDSNRRLYELLEIGRKMTCAMLLADNLLSWSKRGLFFSGLENIQLDLTSIAKSLLQEMEKEHDNLPEEVFSEDYGEFDSLEEERGEIARELRSVCDKLRGWLSLEPRFPEANDEF